MIMWEACLHKTDVGSSRIKYQVEMT